MYLSSYRYIIDHGATDLDTMCALIKMHINFIRLWLHPNTQINYNLQDKENRWFNGQLTANNLVNFIAFGMTKTVYFFAIERLKHKIY